MRGCASECVCMPANRWNFPDLGLGLGLRAAHIDHVLAHRPDVDFFEVISENYMYAQGRGLHRLEQIAEQYPVVLHGVGLSIGGTDPLDQDYLARLKNLAHRLRTPWVSDHLCWTGVMGLNTHDLLPLPLDEATLRHTVARVRAVQQVLERPLVLENPSSYVAFTASSMDESEFLSRLADEADCGLLLDVNNVYVSAFNHGFDAADYIDAIAPERVVYHHLAGHTHKGTHILDTHDDHVIDAVWQLYGRCHARTGGRATLVEWDDRLPAFEVLHAEVRKAGAWRESGVTTRA